MYFSNQDFLSDRNSNYKKEIFSYSDNGEYLSFIFTPGASYLCTLSNPGNYGNNGAKTSIFTLNYPYDSAPNKIVRLNYIHKMNSLDELIEIENNFNNHTTTLCWKPDGKIRITYLLFFGKKIS